MSKTASVEREIWNVWYAGVDDPGLEFQHMLSPSLAAHLRKHLFWLFNHHRAAKESTERQVQERLR